MARPLSGNLKRGRGRPATGHDPAVTTRLPDGIIAALDTLAKEKECTRGELLREIVASYLKRRGWIG